jgi:hypothetical protein
MKKKSAKKGGKKQQAAQEDEEVEVIRCVCGAVSTPEDDPEPWIACDSCGVWQHIVCVGLASVDDEIPEEYEYSCEKCGPEFPPHKELLDSIARGEKIWEERRRVYEKQQADEGASKKKGKKGKGKTQSEPKSELSHGTNGKAKSPLPVPELKKEKKETPVRAGSTKRKTRDESHEKESAKVCWIKSHFPKHINATTGTPAKGPQSFCRAHNSTTKIPTI